MSEFYFLQSLYMRQLKKDPNCSWFYHQVGNYLNGQVLHMEELIEDFSCFACFSPKKSVEHWKHLLTLNLINYDSSSQPYSVQLSSLVHKFELQPWNQSSQFFRLIVALNHFLVRLPVPEVGVHLLESGAALIDFEEYSPWLAIPYHPYHLEFGVLLSLLGIFLKRPDIEKNVKRLTEWQLNLLDANDHPFPGVFVRERDSNYFEIVLLYYLLFKGAACLTKEEKFAYFANRLGNHVQELFEEQSVVIHPLWVLVERLFAPPLFVESVIQLPSQIYDSSTSLVGFRAQKYGAICTLHGCQTGLGYMREHDVEIRNYGPQYFPLDNCKGFGIEGNHLSDHDLRQSFLECNRSGFSIKGCVRVVDQPAVNSEEKAHFRGIWVDVLQEYKNRQMHIKTNFLGLDGWDDMAFCFFVKAHQCKIHSQLTLLSGRLDRYEGDIVPIQLEGSQAALELTAQQQGRMQVIPLCGGNYFWGANFLVAYLLDSQQARYGWTIERSKFISIGMPSKC